MTPIYQTKHSEGEGNCFAACVASLLDRKIEDVDVDVSSCKNVHHLMSLVAQKADCKIYYATHEAIENGILKTSERFCIVEVCTCVFGGDPYDNGSTWHVVVGEVADDGRITMLFNPDTKDQRQKSLEQFPAVRKVFFVKAN
jgi:hypothetical protein